VPEYLIYIFLFLFGASIGSFLNVCIHRLPLHKSIVSPPSACPNCERAIPFYENIPILSYLLLRGKCGGCGGPISIRYMMVELIIALLAIALFILFGPTIETPVYFVFLSALIVVTFIDIKHQIIPDVISLPGIVVGFGASFLISFPGPIDSIIGIIAGGGTLFLVAFGYYLITGREGMGGGDVKLLAMIGAFLGWRGVIVAIFAGSFVGAFVGIICMLIKGKDMKYAVPFGPFLALGSVAYLFFGETLIELYMMNLWQR
jgi:leader peptidase (prepilin peptidase) / N-methyltransferase